MGAGAPVDPDRLFELARLNKMLGVLPLAPAALPPGCGGLAPRLLQVHLQTVAMNRRAMAVTLEVVEALRPLRHAVLKGPFQQLAVHGHANRRPSGDIDLYVAPRDRALAAALLEGLGFRPTEAERALWWIRFLGEQHFQRASDGAVVDLHHRLQQVGLPAWQRAGQVLDRAETRMQDGVAVPVPAAIDGCLLLAVQLAKALLAHEPCGWAVAELAHWLVQLTPGDWQRLWQAAAAAGQDRTLALAMALVTAFYGPLRLAWLLERNVTPFVPRPGDQSARSPWGLGARDPPALRWPLRPAARDRRAQAESRHPPSSTQPADHPAPRVCRGWRRPRPCCRRQGHLLHRPGRRPCSTEAPSRRRCVGHRPGQSGRAGSSRSSIDLGRGPLETQPAEPPVSQVQMNLLTHAA